MSVNDCLLSAYHGWILEFGVGETVRIREAEPFPSGSLHSYQD